MTKDDLNLSFTPPPGYEIIEYLGGGAMGEVFKAVQTSLDREVAIKTTLPQANPRIKLSPQRLLNEARTIAKLDYPGIVRIYDCFDHEKRVFIVMELLDGKTLSELLYAKEIDGFEPFFRNILVRPHQLRPEWVKRIGIEVALSLDYAHDRGVYHRDVKPSNLFITRSGEIKLFDFGIALDVTTTGMTATGTVMGSPPYMSPEQVRGEEIDGRSDIYSLGCVLFHCATGQTPFNDTSEVLLCMKHLEVPPPDPQQLTSLCGDHMRKVILRCLEKEPDNRYEWASEISQALRDATVDQMTVITSARQTAGATVDPHYLIPEEHKKRIPTSRQEPVDTDVYEAISGEMNEQATMVMKAAGRRRTSGTGWAVLLFFLIVLATVGTFFAMKSSVRENGRDLLVAWNIVHPPDVTDNGGPDDPVLIAANPSATPTPMPEATFTPSETPIPANIVSSAPVLTSPTLAIADAETPAHVQGTDQSMDESLQSGDLASPFAMEDVAANTKWEQLNRWVEFGLHYGKYADTKEGIVPGCVDFDPSSGELTLEFINSSSATLELSFLIVDGSIDVDFLDSDWSVKTKHIDFSGLAHGDAFIDPVRLISEPYGSVVAPLFKAQGLPLRVNVKIDDIRLSTRIFGSDTITTLSLNSNKSNLKLPVLENAMLAPIAREWNADYLLDRSLKGTELFEQIANDDQGRGDPRLYTLSIDDAEDALRQFLKNVVKAFDEGCLIDSGLFRYKNVMIEPYTGVIDLEIEFLAPDLEIVESCFIVDGEQSVTVRKGSQTYTLQRSLDGFHNMGKTVSVNRAKKAFRISFDRLFIEDGESGNDLTFVESPRLIINKMLILCARQKKNEDRENKKGKIDFEVVSGIRINEK